VELVEDQRTIRRELVEMTRETRDLRREVVGNHNLIAGLTENLGREVEDRVGAVLHNFVYTKLIPF
jgi:hypothetical protein